MVNAPQERCFAALPLSFQLPELPSMGSMLAPMQNPRIRAWLVAAALTAGGLAILSPSSDEWDSIYERYDHQIDFVDFQETKFLDYLQNIADNDLYEQVSLPKILPHIDALLGVDLDTRLEALDIFMREGAFLRNTPGSREDVANVMLKTGNATPENHAPHQISLAHLLTLKPRKGEVGGACPPRCMYRALMLGALYPDMVPHMRVDSRSWLNEEGEYDLHISLWVDAVAFGHEGPEGEWYYIIDGTQIKLTNQQPKYADQSIQQVFIDRILAHREDHSQIFTRPPTEDNPVDAYSMVRQLYDFGEEAERGKKVFERWFGSPGELFESRLFFNPQVHTPEKACDDFAWSLITDPDEWQSSEVALWAMDGYEYRETTAAEIHAHLTDATEPRVTSPLTGDQVKGHYDFGSLQGCGHRYKKQFVCTYDSEGDLERFSVHLTASTIWLRPADWPVCGLPEGLEVRYYIDGP